MSSNFSGEDIDSSRIINEICKEVEKANTNRKQNYSHYIRDLVNSTKIPNATPSIYYPGFQVVDSSQVVGIENFMRICNTYGMTYEMDSTGKHDKEARFEKKSRCTVFDKENSEEESLIPSRVNTNAIQSDDANVVHEMNNVSKDISSKIGNYSDEVDSEYPFINQTKCSIEDTIENVHIAFCSRKELSKCQESQLNNSNKNQTQILSNEQSSEQSLTLRKKCIDTDEYRIANNVELSHQPYDQCVFLTKSRSFRSKSETEMAEINDGKAKCTGFNLQSYKKDDIQPDSLMDSYMKSCVKERNSGRKEFKIERTFRWDPENCSDQENETDRLETYKDPESSGSHSSSKNDVQNIQTAIEEFRLKYDMNDRKKVKDLSSLKDILPKEKEKIRKSTTSCSDTFYNDRGNYFENPSQHTGQNETSSMLRTENELINIQKEIKTRVEEYIGVNYSVGADFKVLEHYAPLTVSEMARKDEIVTKHPFYLRTVIIIKTVCRAFEALCVRPIYLLIAANLNVLMCMSLIFFFVLLIFYENLKPVMMKYFFNKFWNFFNVLKNIGQLFVSIVFPFLKPGNNIEDFNAIEGNETEANAGFSPEEEYFVKVPKELYMNEGSETKDSKYDNTEDALYESFATMEGAVTDLNCDIHYIHLPSNQSYGSKKQHGSDFESDSFLLETEISSESFREKESSTNELDLSTILRIRSLNNASSSSKRVSRIGLGRRFETLSSMLLNSKILSPNFRSKKN